VNGQPVAISSPRDRGRFTVQVCRSCCCGTVRKHPDVDHDAQRSALASAAFAGGGTCRVVDCLDECHASNVVVLRHRDGRPAQWFGHVLRPEDTAALAAWIAGGALGEPPAAAAALQFTRGSASVG
jgi:hypothetical protein